MVEPSALEHQLLAWRLDTGDLEWVQDGVGSELNEGVAETFFLQINRHPCLEDTLVKGGQPIQIGGDKGQVMKVVEQLQDYLLVGNRIRQDCAYEELSRSTMQLRARSLLGPLR